MVAAEPMFDAIATASWLQHLLGAVLADLRRHRVPPLATNGGRGLGLAMPYQALRAAAPEPELPRCLRLARRRLGSYRRATADQARELGASATSSARSLSSSAAGAPTGAGRCHSGSLVASYRGCSGL